MLQLKTTNSGDLNTLQIDKNPVKAYGSQWKLKVCLVELEELLTRKSSM